MRSIQISTDVFAAIWAARRNGEDSEDAILRRLLGLASSAGRSDVRIGFRDSRYNVEVPEGFEVFRTYKGQEYRAIATNGSWRLTNSGKTYPTLNELSVGIGAATENAWQNWLYLDDQGRRQSIDALREKRLISRRSKWYGDSSSDGSRK